MDLATVLAGHLQTLDGTYRFDGGGGDADADRNAAGFAAGLSILTRDLIVEVPSCMAVSIVLSRPGGDITFSAPAAGIGSIGAPAVRASLAVPLAVTGAAAFLLMQASVAGAFVLLAGDLADQLDTGSAALLVDRHLVLQPDPEARRLAVDLADLRAVEQAIGALIGQGRLPTVARQELHDRALEADLTAPALARQLLAALADRARPD